MIYLHSDLDTYFVFHENHAQWNYLVLLGVIKLFGEKRFVNSVKLFPVSIKSIRPIQKYPHIIKSYACILKIFVVIDKRRSINALISFGICSAPKESKQVTLFIPYKAAQWVAISECSSRFIT